MESFVTKIRTNLAGALQMTKMIDGIMMTGDNAANVILVELNRNGTRVRIDPNIHIVGYFIRGDGYTTEVDGEVTEDGAAKVIIPRSAYNVPGNLSIAVRMISGNTKVVIASASCFVNITETDSIIDPDHKIPDVQDLLQYIDELDALKNAMEETEEEVSTSENARVAAEQIRISNETARQTAESGRASAESTRVSNENARQTAESGRVSAESTRVSNENTRKTEETGRANAESTRVSNETARQTAEQTRISAENQRVSNETARQSAETDRVQADADRTTRNDAAIAKIDNMTVAASQNPVGSQPTATISEVSGHKHIAFGIPKGDPGKDFRIKKTFISISQMETYTGSDIEENDFAMIDTGNVEDPDTGKLYCYEPSNTPKWRYIGDLSGAQGIKGETGNGIASVQLNADYTLTITYTDGTSVTTTSIRGEKGDKGDTGNGIAGIDINADDSLTINMTDGTSVTTDPVRGPKGEPGVNSFVCSYDLSEDAINVLLG